MHVRNEVDFLLAIENLVDLETLKSLRQYVDFNVENAIGGYDESRRKQVEEAIPNARELLDKIRVSDSPGVFMWLITPKEEGGYGHRFDPWDSELDSLNHKTLGTYISLLCQQMD